MEQYLPQLIQAAIHTALLTAVAAIVGFPFWIWKQKLSKKARLAEESRKAEKDKGPVLHIKEHEDMCFEEKQRETQGHATVINELSDIATAMSKGFDEVKESVKEVHTRVDDTQKMFIKHIQDELNSVKR